MSLLPVEWKQSDAENEFANSQLLNIMDWSNKTISPKRDQPPKVNIRFPCPGLCRFVGTVSFLGVGLGVYYGGTALLGLEPLNWAAPVWTGKHVGLFVAAILLGALGGLLGFAYTMTIEVRSERRSDLYIVLWQFLANGSLVWVGAVGIAMSVSLGTEEAKAAVLHFGAERATLHVVATGGLVSLLSGIAFFRVVILRMPLFGYFAFSASVSLLATRWQFSAYGIEGQSWIQWTSLVVGLATPILLLVLARPMIERDRRQRRLVMERSL